MSESASDEVISPIDRLLAIEEIKRLKAKYFYYLDHNDWGSLRTCVFAPNLVFYVPEFRSEPWTDADSFIAWATGLQGQRVSVHHGHMPDIEILTPTTAKGVWAMEDILHYPRINDSPTGFNSLHGYGHYHETYVRTTGSWRIQSVGLTRLYVVRD